MKTKLNKTVFFIHIVEYVLLHFPTHQPYFISLPNPPTLLNQLPNPSTLFYLTFQPSNGI